LFQRINSKIIRKIGILVIIEIVIIISSFGILAYFESQSIFLGNSINIAGKNRFLISNILIQISQYLTGSSSDVSRINTAMDALKSNILVLREGGKVSDMDLKPLPSNYLDSWNIINEKWNTYKGFIIDKIIKPSQQQIRTAIILDRSTIRGLETMALDLSDSSDTLIARLGESTQQISQNLTLLEILLGILNIGFHLIMFYFIIKILRPVYVLTHATNEVKKGNFNVSVNHKGHDELSVLGESFNSMVRALKDNDKMQKEFLSIASHELRTPIQVILGFVLIGMKGYIKQEEAWEGVLKATHRLQQLSNDIFDVSKIEGGNFSCKIKKVRINDIILDVVKSLKANLHTGVIMETQLDSNNKDIEIDADQNRIAQVLTNIIGNAIKFTNKGVIRIQSDIFSDENKIEIKVSDTGGGIPEDIFPNLFHKFVSRSTTNNENKQGSGLGLFISKAIITVHKGEITAFNNNKEKGGGATFSILLPINNNNTKVEHELKLR
jgi:signal transduction histidine kinase